MNGCPGNVCPAPSGNVNDLSAYGSTYDYVLANPQIFNPGYKWYSDPQYGVPQSIQYKIDPTLHYQKSPYDYMQSGSVYAPYYARLRELSELKSQFPGAESTYIRWLIGNEMREIRNQIESLRASQKSGAAGAAGAYAEADVYRAASQLPGELTRVAPGEGLSGAERDVSEALQRAQAEYDTGAPPQYQAPEGPPVPDWMLPYLETGMAARTGTVDATRTPRGTTQPSGTHLEGGRRAAELRPLGAQAELTPDQLGQMAGYMGWGRAGSPWKFSEGAVMKMADWQRYWDEYVRLSQKLFPTQVRMQANWRAARQ